MKPDNLRRGEEARGQVSGPTAESREPFEPIKVSVVGRILLVLLVLSMLTLAGFVLREPASMRRNQKSVAREVPQLLRIDESLFEVSAMSGGDFWMWAPLEFSQATNLEIPVAGEDLLLAYNRLDEEPVEHAFPVDAFVGRIDVFASAQQLERVRLSRPDGREVLAGDEGVRVQAYSHTRLVTVSSPHIGSWRLEVDGRGLSSISVRAHRRTELPDSEMIELIDVQFVEPGGRPGHEGLFPADEVTAGDSSRIEVVLSGPAASVEVAFTTRDGRALDSGPIQLLEMQEGCERCWFLCTVPAQPFRIAVHGRDETGSVFRRMHGSVFIPKAP